ncbi:MAG: InlB B-repeat-containing protein, partial [Clostridiales bacterium]|nr:InlB B-repeat-containing protein [Clostridiales bacterium]
AYTVTFDSKDGSAVASQTIVSGGKVTKPADPTREGYAFEGWYKEDTYATAWNFATDTVTGNTTLYAKWENTSELRLHILNNGTWTDMVAVGHNNDTEIKVTGVHLAVGTRFVPFKGDDWYHPQATITQYTYQAPIATVVSDGDCYEITALHSDYANVLWTLYIKQDGSGISLEVPINAYENRNTKGNGTLQYSTTAPNNTIYIAGTFTDGFKYHKDWSLESTAITVLDEREAFKRVSFRGVYLKKNDAFKIVYNGVWYGGNMKDPLLSTGGGISTQPDTDGASAPNIVLPMIEDGYYNIVFSIADSHWCRLEIYEPPTITSVVVTPPTKTTYFVGETYNDSGMTVTITDSEGKTHNDDYTVTGADTSTAGIKTVTVTYTGNIGGTAANKKATFTITVNKITVTYDSKGGSTVAANNTATYNSTITAPTAPTKTNYVFAGWYKESACQNLWDFATDKVTGNITLYAKWLRDVKPGTYLHILTDFTAEVEDDKWSDMYSPVSHNNDTEWKIEGVKLQQGTKFLVVTYVANGNHTWYSVNDNGFTQWTYNDIITIEKEGGDFKVTSINVGYVDVAWTLYINKNGTDISLEIPKNADVKRNPDGTINNNLTYSAAPATAVYIAGNFTDGFKYHQNWSSDSMVITVLKEKKEATSSFAYTRFEFRHVYLKKGDCFKIVDNGVWWGGDFDETANGFVMSSDSARDLFVPMLEDGYYDIIYNNNGSHEARHFLRIIPYKDPTIASVTVTAPTKTAYFVGEAFNQSGMVVTITDTDGKTHNTEYTMTGATTASAGTKTVTITYNGTLGGDAANKTATFTITVSYITVTYNSQGGSSVAANSTVTYNSTIAKPADPTREGYTFGGWYKESGCTNAWTFGASGDKVTSNITLYAKWTINSYDLTYVYDNGTASSTSKVEYNKTITLAAAPTKTNYVFGGWSDGTKTYSAGASYTMPAKNVTLTAQWGSGSYTVTFNSNGGSAVSAQTIAHGGKVTQPANPTKANCSFGGWYKDASFATAWNFNTDTVTSVTTLYAKWNVTVTFNSNGGSAVTAQTIVSGGKATKPTDPTKTGNSFGGWYSNSTLTTAWNFNTTVTANTTLYAKWNVNTYALKYVYGNGTADSSSQVDYNKAITLAAAPTRTGYTFSGWNDGTTTRAAGSSYTMPAKAVTMTAVWARVNGLFNGETLVQAFVVSDTGKEYAAKCFKVASACTLTVYVDNKVGTVTNIKYGSDSNVTYNNGLKFNKAGVYTVYYRYVQATNGDITGIYVVRHGEASDYLTPNLQSTDGVYVGNTKVGSFVFNDNNMNQVMATNVTITAANASSAVDVTFKYEGKAVTLTQIDLADGITNAGTATTVKLYNGTYSFYYNFGKNNDGIKGRIWIEGTQTGAPAIKLEANSAAFQFNDATIVLRIDFANFSGWGTLSNPRVHIWKGADTDLTGGWDNRKLLDGKSTYKINSNIGDDVKMILTFDENGGNKQSVDMTITSFKNGKQYTLTGGAITGWTDGKFSANLIESNIVYA